MSPLPEVDTAAYRCWAAETDRLLLFHQPWWLDAVCGADGWTAIMAEERGAVAALPLPLRRRWRFAMCVSPPLTPYLGPALPESRHVKKGSRNSEAYEQTGRLLERLPALDRIGFNLPPGSPAWLPFHWHGFTGVTRYTYVIEQPGDREQTWSAFSTSTRGHIRKAGREVTVSDEGTIMDLFRLTRLTFARQGLPAPYDPAVLARVDSALADRGQHRILFARDESGHTHAGCLLAWDSTTMYYLIGGADPRFLQSGAMSLLLAEGITLAGEMGKRFDFEGSMLPAVERFFRGFGGTPVPYMHVRRDSRMLRIVEDVRDTVLALRGRPARPSW